MWKAEDLLEVAPGVKSLRTRKCSSVIVTASNAVWTCAQKVNYANMTMPDPVLFIDLPRLRTWLFARINMDRQHFYYLIISGVMVTHVEVGLALNKKTTTTKKAKTTLRSQQLKLLNMTPPPDPPLCLLHFVLGGKRGVYMRRVEGR